MLRLDSAAELVVWSPNSAASVDWPYRLFGIALRPAGSHPYRLGVMTAEDQARRLCERAAPCEDPDELGEILAELRALMRQHFAHFEEMIRERRDRADLEHVLDKSA